ncbi:MBL fold metallo-hydrolase [Nanoarchaeota archaeon]
MNKIKILIEGYAKKIEKGWLASSTVVLVESKGKNILVDPGCNKEKLIDTLEKNGLNVEDIDYVFLTHNHVDHVLLAGIFNAKVLNNNEIFDSDKQICHNNLIPGTDLEIIQTPGHSEDDCSLVVRTETGIYVIAGDVFWWMDGEEQDIDVEKVDPAHEFNHEKLVGNRKKILQLADFVIPGHGKVFKTDLQHDP